MSEQKAEVGNLKSGGPAPGKARLEENKYRGVKIIFKENLRCRFFCPSSKNFIGDLQQRTAIHDSGCNTHICAIASPEELTEVVSKYDPKSKALRFGFFANGGVSSKHLIMTIQNVNMQNFEVRMCQDILGESVTAQFKTLRLFLCSEDVDTLLGGTALTGTQKMLLGKAVENVHGVRSERRKHALVGQDILQSRLHGSHTFSGVCVVTDRAVFDTSNIYERLENMEVDLVAADFLPKDFETLESDDYTENEFLGEPLDEFYHI